ncbi:phenylalanine--tRNA ligase subunit beta [Rhodococcus sp. Leaf7]|uniref:phenylalanine--tRNA ligase subunit beta n=1 Tax=unclassified Rhodococcus (in: high G+C Gram-positive bacteria) TaxID=192944 RepID=UPI0006FF2E79|nr:MULTISPECIES: phenylalanine--tRNA ligase subunit beta [unclassified Rhodococcus (in: high G+C Gram-positive bacteria)]KQU06172.1 phenylalanine--tRNA ligase subunit beta [Rhodococcus sp. Leaf7]KQU41688.1 phenylalanine--tRNA ligase subunit beta [Rhodococcus sp. Leaf247]
MRVPQSWLTEVVQKAAPGWSVTAEELDAGFVSVGFEIEDVIPLPPITGPLVVGRVRSIEELTEFKKPIRFCLVEVGEAEPRGIVCGARNFAEGDLIVAALPGSVLPGPFAIAARETYGRTSDGMICSVSELGIGSDHSGILVLPEGTARPGDDARTVLGTDDTVFDVNVTPDRGYALSVRGLGRELASGFDLDFTDPADASWPVVSADASEGDAWSVEVNSDSGATRFAARRVVGIDPAAVTPWSIQRRLLLSGVRPISPAVDVTNYVMLELGQPLHAFDAAALSGGLVVRRAAAGETLRTLDDVERTLDPEDVVIADDSGVVSLAGVMGGASTEVGAETTDILLEAAIWSPLSVFRTARRHKLPSEASRRYERVVDSALPVRALDRAASLLASIAGGRVEPLLTDVGGASTPDPVRMELDLPDRVAGVTYANGTAVRRLSQVGCTVEVDVSESGRGVLVVTPPTWRPDLRQPADLVEEVLRLEGLESIPSVLPQAPAGRGLTASQRRRRAVGRALAYTGHVEVLAPVFLPAGVFDVWGLDADDPRRVTTRVLNPLEADRPELATTLLPGLLETAQRNVSRGQRDLALFAVAQVVQPGEGTRPIDALAVDRRPTDDEITALKQSLPVQPLHVAVVLSGAVTAPGPWGAGRPAEAGDAFAAARIIAGASGVEVELRAAQHLPWHPGRCAEIVLDDVVVGWAGELHPGVLERAGLPPRTCAVEIDLDLVPTIEPLPSPSISPFPAVLQDVAVVVDMSVPAASVEKALIAGAGPLLEDIRIFDVFAGEQVGEGRKSLAFALRFRAPDRTLTEAEASAARDAAVAAATDAVGAELRH